MRTANERTAGVSTVVSVAERRHREIFHHRRERRGAPRGPPASSTRRDIASSAPCTRMNNDVELEDEARAPELVDRRRVLSLRRPSSQLMTVTSLVRQAGLVLLLVVAWRICESESFFIDEKQSPQMSEWNYSDQAQWSGINRECSGRAQSPIDIKQRNVIISKHLRLRFYNYDKQIRFKLANAHHTIKMNPIGPAYEQDLEQPGAGERLGLNASSIHEIMTADEYVEFTPTSNPRSSSAGGAALTAGPAAAGPNEQQHLGRLVGANSTATGDGLRSRWPLPAPPARHNDDRGHQQMNSIEHERELEHGQRGRGGGGGNGGGLFGFHLAKETPVQFEPTPNYDGAPTIKLDWLDEGNNEYKLRDIHFHWGERRDNGSEHAIDGRRAAMEMHLVHIKRGLDKSSIGFTSDSVAVIAILIESHRKSNLDFNPIVNELARINSSERAQEIDYKSLYDLLPNNLQAFYTYSGSLTTPPCYQVVNWIVMAERLNMNAKQIEMFRNLYAPPPERHSGIIASLDGANGSGHHHDNHGDDPASSGSHLIMPNVRMLQSLNNRTIMASFTKHGSRLESVYYTAGSLQGSLGGGARLSMGLLVLLIVQFSLLRLSTPWQSIRLEISLSRHV